MNPSILDALKELEKERNIPFDKIVQALEDALLKAYERHFGANQDVVIEIDRTTGALSIWQHKLVVPEVENHDTEMTLEEAKQLSDDAEIGMELDIEVPSGAFGRIAAQTAKQVIIQRVHELERDQIRDEYESRKGEIVNCRVRSHERRECIVSLNNSTAEGVIPVQEQAHNEFLRKDDMIKAVILSVRDGQQRSPHPQVVVSRASSDLLRALFETQVPEIARGIVQIVAVVREAGLRSKIAVKSADSTIDPVGACVGPKGTRVQAIVDELRGEKIDVIPWSEDPEVFVANSLQPSRVTKVTLNPEGNNATLVVPDAQLPLAIGREGQNARLAAKLTGWHIDIKPESKALEAEAAARLAAEAASSQEEAAATEATPPAQDDAAPVAPVSDADATAEPVEQAEP